MRRRTNIAVLLALTSATFVSLASASPTFPGEIKRHLGAADTPPCTTCHQGNPGIGTATSPFVVAMKQRGLVANDTASLDNALDALDGEMTDTDGDGVPDVEELRRGWDPNVPNLADGGVAEGAARPMSLQTWYGCAFRASGPRRGSRALALMLLALFAHRRRRVKTKTTTSR